MENNKFNEEKSTETEVQRRKPRLWMLLCCLLPVAAVSYYALSGSGTRSLGSLLMLLICPLMHIAMMFGMRKGKSCH